VHLHNQRVILFYVLSFFALLMCIFTIKGQYYPMYTHFAKNNMEMHFVSTFWKCLFSFKFIRSISFQNSLNFLGNLCAKKSYIFCKMPFNWCTKSRFNKVTTRKWIFCAKHWTPLKMKLPFLWIAQVTLVEWLGAHLNHHNPYWLAFFLVPPTLAHQIPINT
jgi:hypothetical protein